MEYFNYGWTIDDIKYEYEAWKRAVEDGEWNLADATSDGVIIDELLLNYERLINLYDIIVAAQDEYNEIAYELYKAGGKK